MNLDALAGGGAAALTALLAWRWRSCWTSWSLAERVAAVLAVPGLLLLALILVKTPLRMLNDDLSAARLAPAVAMTFGYDLYGRADQGPILNTIYGPLTALVYLPAAACSTPTGAVIAGGVITLLLFVGALGGAFHALGAASPFPASLRLLGFLSTFALLSSRRGTSYWFDNIHADAPALAFGLAACSLLLLRDGAVPGRARLAASAVCSVLAVFSKQTSLGLPLALALCVGWTGGRRSFAFFAVVASAAALLLGTLASLAFGLDAMWFNVVTIPSRHAWEGKAWRGLVDDALLLMFEQSAFVLIALAIGATSWLLEQRGDPRPWRARLSREPWMPFALAALVLLPTSTLGRVKVGGDENSNHSLLFLAVVAAILLLRACSGASSRIQRGLRILGMGVVLLAYLMAIERERGRSVEIGPDVLRNNPQQVAYDFVRGHPRQVWLANNPLVTLYADGRLYHFDYGVFDRILAGFPPTERHLWEHLPEELRYVSRGQRSALAGSVLGDFRRKVATPMQTPIFVRASP